MIVSIEKLIYGGEGLARTPGADGRSMAVFVPFVLPGEKVEAEIRQEKPGFVRGRVTRIVEAAEGRVEARCPYFGRCGGCQYQHIEYARQLEFKAGILRETLQRVGKIELKTEIRLHGTEAWNYRNRTRLQVRTEDGFALGYFETGSHKFLEVRECPISSPLINRVMARLGELGGAECPAEVEEIEFFADAEDEHVLAWAFCGKEAAIGGSVGPPFRKERGRMGQPSSGEPPSGEAAVEGLTRWAEAVRREVPEICGMTFFRSRRRGEDEDAPVDVRPLAESGAKAIRYRTKAHEYQVSAGSFFQVNRYLVDELVEVVTGGAAGEMALDLYAGVGLFSAALAGRIRHILGVEASQTAEGDFRQNVPANVKLAAARAEDFLASGAVRKRPDLVVLDPPRAGAGKTVMRKLVEMATPEVRYVSCDPATLARDLVFLTAAGYRIERVDLFDLFPGTFHMETVVCAVR